jgi:hypothetical protein
VEKLAKKQEIRRCKRLPEFLLVSIGTRLTVLTTSIQLQGSTMALLPQTEAKMNSRQREINTPSALPSLSNQPLICVNA